MSHPTRVDPSPCPYCGNHLDAASGLTGANRPKAGDCSICIYCAQPLRFTSDLRLRKFRVGELEAVYQADREFQRGFEGAMQAVRALDRRKNH